MLNIPFGDSGNLKYYEKDNGFNYSYSVNTTDYPTMHSHTDYWEFCILLQGSIKNQILGAGTQLYVEKTLFFMTTQDRHAMFKASPQIRYVNIPVRETHLLQLLNAISPTFKDRLLQGERSFPIPDTLIAEIENLLHQCNLLSSKQVEKKNGLLCSAVLLLLQELNRIHLNVHENSSPFMKKLFAITEKMEFIGYSVNDLKNALNYSTAHLNRLFKEHLNTTPHEYLQKHKFRYAKNLLQNTDLSMMEIASKIGYSNLSHFFSNFKKHYGVTPGQYRKGL